MFTTPQLWNIKRRRRSEAPLLKVYYEKVFKFQAGSYKSYENKWFWNGKIRNVMVVLPYTKYCLKPWSLTVLDYIFLFWVVTYSYPFFVLWFVDVYLCLEREVRSRFPLKVSWDPLWQCIGKVCVVQLVPWAKLEPIIADKKDAIQHFRHRG